MSLWRLKATAGRVFLWLWLAGPALQVGAQITPGSDPSFAPKIGVAPNGVPVVDIVKPGVGGVSLNRYGQFNVAPSGAILNNSVSGGTSVLGGVLNGNPNLSGAAARVILNEVRGAGQTSLTGPLEVFGAQAEVVIANANGIVVNGGRFLNTSRLGLATGQAALNGAGELELEVSSGGLVIEGSGLDASNVGEVNLLGKTIRVNGPLRAGNVLELLSGSRRYNQATRQSSGAVASGSGEGIDASELGAMNAGKIVLESRDDGVGVKARGNMAASSGGLTLSADGKITLGRRGGSNSVQGNLSAQSRRGAVEVEGQSKVGGAATVKGRNVAVKNEALLQAAALRVEAADSVSVEPLGVLQTVAAGPLEMLAGSGGIVQSGALDSSGLLKVSTSGALLQSGLMQSGADLEIRALSASLVTPGLRQLDSAGSVSVTVDTVFEAKGNVQAMASITLSGDVLISRERMLARSGVLSFNATTRVENNGVLSAPFLDFAGPAPLYNINGGFIKGRADLVRLPLGGLDNDGGFFYWEGDLAYAPTFLNLGSGVFEVTGNFDLKTSGDFSNGPGGRLVVGGSLSMETGRNWSNAGVIAAQNGGLNVNAYGELRNESTGELIFPGDVLLRSAGHLLQAGKVNTNGEVELAAGGEVAHLGQTQADGAIGIAGSAYLSKDGSVLSAMGSIGIETRSGDAVMAGRLASWGDLVITSKGGVVLESGLNAQSGAGITITAAGGDLSGAPDTVFSALGDVVMQAQAQLRVGGVLTAGGALSLNGNAGVSLLADSDFGSLGAGQIRSAGAVDLQGRLRSGAGLYVLATGAIRQGVAGILATEAELVLSSGGAVELAGAGYSGAALTISSGGELRLQSTADYTAEGDVLLGAGTFLGLEGRLQTLGFAALQSAGDLEIGSDALVVALGEVSLNAAQDLEIAGQVSVGETLTASSSAGALNVLENALVEAVGNVGLEGQTSLSLAGRVQSEGAIALLSHGTLNVVETAQVASGEWLTLDAVGDLTLAGNLSAVGLLQIQSSGTFVQEEGSAVLAGGALNVDALGDLIVNGSLSSQGSVDLQAVGYLGQGTTGNVTALGNLTLQSSADDVLLSGKLTAGGLSTIRAGNDLWQFSSSEIASKGDVLTTSAGLSIFDGKIQSEGALDLWAGEFLEQGTSGRLAANGDIVLESATGGLMLDGHVNSGGLLTLKSASTLEQGALSELTSVEKLQSTSAGYTLLNGIIRTENVLDVWAGTSLGVGGSGRLASLGNLLLESVTGDLALSGSLISGGTVELSAGRDLLQLPTSLILAQGDITATSLGSTVWGGHVQTHGNLSSLAGGFMGVDSTGRVAALQTIRLTSYGADALIGGWVTSGGDLTIESMAKVAGILEGAVVQSAEDAALLGKGGVLSQGSLTVQGNLGASTSLNAVWSSSAWTRVGGDVLIQSSGTWTQAGNFGVDGSMAVSALGGLTQSGRLAVQGDLSLKGLTKIENSGWTGAGGTLVAESFGDLLNSGRLAAENGISITLIYGNLTNSGEVLSGASTVLQVGGSFSNTGVFTARQSLVGSVTGLLVNTTPDPWNIYTDPAAPETLPWSTFGPLPLAPEPAILSAGQDLSLTVGGDVLNQESTLSGGRSMLLVSGGSIINAGGRVMAGIGGSVIKGMTFTNTTAGGLIEEKDWDRYMVIYDDTKVYDTKIGGVPVLYRKNIGIMGYHRSRYFGGESGLLSAVGDLTVDVASGSNEASVIVSGGELNLLGLWENKSDYDVYSKSWLALDEGFAEIGGTTRERLEEGGHDHFGEVARRVHDGTVSIRDDTGTGENRLRVFKYAEDVLGIDPREHGGEDTGWVAMESVVVMGGISDRTYLRFHLIEDYQEDEVHRTAIIHGHQGTNVILLNDDYGTSWAGIGGALAEQPFVVDGPHTGLAPGTITVDPINAAASVANLDLSGLAVPHSPVAELAVNVATPVAPDVNLAIALGDLDSAPQVGRDVLQSRLPTASTLPQVQAPLGQNVTFTLSGYEPLTFLPPGNVPTPDGSIGSGGAGLPGYVFTSGSTGPNPTTGTLPDYYRDGNTLNGYTPTEPDANVLPNVTLSQALLDRLAAGPSSLGPLLNTDVLRQNVRETLELDPENPFDPEALREASAESSAHLLRTQLEENLDANVEVDLANVMDPELRDTLAAISTLGAYGGRGVFDAAGPMVNVGSEDGVVTLETAKRKEIAEVIKERSQKYLEQELALKKQREDWINEQLAGMEEGPARDAMAKSLEKEAEKKFGPSYYERIDLMTEAQTQRLYQELFPPESSGSGIWGSIIGAVIGIIVGILTLGAGLVASMAIAAATSFVTTTATALISGADWGDALVAGLISGVIAGVTAGLTYGIMQVVPGLNTIGQTVSKTIGGTVGKVTGVFVEAGTKAFVSNLVNAGINKVVYGRTGSGVLRNALTSAAVAGFMAAGAMTIGHVIDWKNVGPEVEVPGALMVDRIGTGEGNFLPVFRSEMSLGELILKPLLHGALQGGVQELFGGKFKDGFIAGATSSFAEPFINGAVYGLSGGSSSVYHDGGIDWVAFNSRETVSTGLNGILTGAVSTATGGSYETGSMISSVLSQWNGDYVVNEPVKAADALAMIPKLGVTSPVFKDGQLIGSISGADMVNFFKSQSPEVQQLINALTFKDTMSFMTFMGRFMQAQATDVAQLKTLLAQYMYWPPAGKTPPGGWEAFGKGLATAIKPFVDPKQMFNAAAGTVTGPLEMLEMSGTPEGQEALKNLFTTPEGWGQLTGNIAAALITHKITPPIGGTVPKTGVPTLPRTWPTLEGPVLEMVDDGAGTLVWKEALSGSGTKTIVPYSGQPTPTSWPGNYGFLTGPYITELKPGTLIDRYGAEDGTFVALSGTPFEMRGLPDTLKDLTPTAYEVMIPLRVQSGLTAPAFGNVGLGDQYKLPFTIEELLELKVIRKKP